MRARLTPAALVAAGLMALVTTATPALELTFADAPLGVVPKDFEAALVRGDGPVVEVVSDSAHNFPVS